jgi:hypothetical protein
MKIKKSEFKKLILEEVTDFYNQAGQRMINMAEFIDSDIPSVDRAYDLMDRAGVDDTIDTPTEIGEFVTGILQYFLDPEAPRLHPRDLTQIRDIVYGRDQDEEFEEAPPEEFEVEDEDVDPLDV